MPNEHKKDKTFDAASAEEVYKIKLGMLEVSPSMLPNLIGNVHRPQLSRRWG